MSGGTGGVGPPVWLEARALELSREHGSHRARNRVLGCRKRAALPAEGPA
jgi:hypothetical protein